jgi:hypothetical protein
MEVEMSKLGSMKASLLAAAGLSNLLTATSTAAAAANPAAPDLSGTQISGLDAEAQAELVDTLKAATEHGRIEGHAAGSAETAARWGDVFSSASAQQNPTLACFLLQNSTASAADINKQLEAHGPAVVPAAAAPAAAAPAPAVVQPTVTGMVEDTPLASRAPGSDGNDDDDKPIDNSAVFPGVDFSGKSSITEDGMRRPNNFVN